MKDSEIIERIKKGDEIALDYIYKKNFKTIIRMILNHKGSKDEAKDIYQEATIIFWQNALKDDFVLTSKISTYLYAVCRNLWRKELERKSRISEEAPKEDDMVEKGFNNNIDEKERIDIITKSIAKLGNTCRQVLTYYYFDGLSMQDISEKMGFSNADTAKTKKYKCKKELDNLIKSNYKATDFLD